MRAVRDDALAVLDNAAIRRSALGAVDASASFPWLGELDPRLADRITTAPRLQARLFERVARDECDPAGLAEDLRRFLLLDAAARRRAAIRAGLAYHIASFGLAVTRSTLETLTAAFGKRAVAFALANSHLAAGVSPAAQQDGNRLHAMIEADGWAILKLWTSSRGLARLWQAGWGKGCEGGSVSLRGAAAQAIAAAVVARMDELEGDDAASGGAKP